MQTDGEKMVWYYTQLRIEKLSFHGVSDKEFNALMRDVKNGRQVLL